ncbi:hypothetical protein CVT26_005685 [Gymnopilus dilepis]|uniref:USP8 dimerisation domain-containing protein n=1 Tax=Gymnopilus dilepis TaxID=231916 RepID=A0A409XZZ3_9AGAR|nr:hypothetical protein CVT26_005685 [Gymnopilus dilepis]
MDPSPLAMYPSNSVNPVHITPPGTRRRTRPLSIAELAKEVSRDLWDENKDFKHYLRVIEKYRWEGKECAKQGDLEHAFVQFARAATLALEKLPLHRDYHRMLNEDQRHNLSLVGPFNGQDILYNLMDLKPTLVERYDKWLQEHPDGADNEQPIYLSRPASISELAKEAMGDLWDENKGFKHYLRVAEKYRREGKECAKRGDLEGAFVQLARAATLALEKLPLHRDYYGVLNESQRYNLSLVDNLSDLKPALVERYDKWLQKHPDEIDHELTSNTRTQKIANDVPGRTSEEHAHHQEREQAQLMHEQHEGVQSQDSVFRPLVLDNGHPEPWYLADEPFSDTYSLASSRTETTDYGNYARRMAFSQETSFSELPELQDEGYLNWPWSR